MNFSLVLLSLFSFFSLSVRAQYGPSSGSSPSSSASSPSETDSGSACTPGNIHQVTVGQNGNKFDPSITFAHPGDIVVFTFFPSNHSVIRTDYTEAKSNSEYSGNPCVPIEVLQPGTEGFFSGNKVVELIPSPGNVSAGTVRRRASLTVLEQAVTWNLTIVDRNPIWFYCDAPGSCHPNGMVGAINPVSKAILF
jgi:plastocyanin